ncbi:hypothetical protein SAMN05421877_104217 [Sphingobacterium lactis]|uniref:Uncharacterized protein n=2 Tax=Sphingobacterium lactis TaxID=797291 RepID=A0A1H5X022_9SPHI|nr:hypothetical protein SAMN05421877_104217 [Sphingobacterium lactis]
MPATIKPLQGKSIYYGTMKENNTYHENLEGNNLPNSLRVNPFIVPKNYFEELADRTLFLARLDQLSTAGKVSGFSVPEDFFKNQASQLISQIKIDQIDAAAFTVPANYFDQLGEQVLGQVKIDGLQDEADVPAGYFEQLSSRIMDRIQEEEEVAFSLELQDTGFTVPEGYFDAAEEEILANVAVEELQGLVKSDGFTVPNSYFDQLSNNILEQVQDKKVISLPSREERKEKTPAKRGKVYAWFTTAAAACVAAVIGLSVYNGAENKPMEVEPVALNDIPEEEIINYLSSYSDASDLEYIAEYIYQPEETKGVGTGIDEDVLEDYLNYTL